MYLKSYHGFNKKKKVHFAPEKGTGVMGFLVIGTCPVRVVKSGMINAMVQNQTRFK